VLKTAWRRISVAVVLTAAVTAAPAAAHASAVTLHAAPAGTGTKCSAQAPCSLTAAQRAVRNLHPATSGDAVTVRLNGGTYDLAHTWKFTTADSGSPAHPVLWTSAPGAQPVISGARPVTAWSPVSGAANVWQARVPRGSATRQLYVDGQEVPVAQKTPSQLGFSGGWKGTSSDYDISGDPAAMQFFSGLTHAQLTGVEFVYPGGNGAWTQSECRVHAYAAGTLTMDEPCWRDVTNRVPFSAGSGGLPSMSTSQMPASIRNAYALLSAGQWFLDSSSRTLYFDGPQSMSGLDVELPHLQGLLRGVGSLSDPVHDLTFSGIQFSYATWNAPSNPAGFADVQSNLRMSLPGGNQGECTFSSPAGTCPWGALTQPLVNVGFSGADDITVSHDRFEDLGGAALGFEYGDRSDTVKGSLFDHIGSTAVLLGCTYDPNPTDPADAQEIVDHCSLSPTVAAGDSIGSDEILRHTTVEDNVIENVGTDYPSACGITLLFSQHTTITHNDIFDVPYTAITAGVIQGHVDDQTHPQNSTNINGFNTISDNLIHDYLETLNDGGAMYIEGHQAQYVEDPDGSVNQTQTLADGMQAVGNVAYDKVGFSPVMYDDAGSEYINWQDNVAFKLNGNAAQGGCDPTGPFGLEDNMASGGFESYGCLPSGVSITTFASGNTSIPDAPGPNELPASAIDGAGIDAADASLMLSRPQAFYVSPESSATAAIPNAVLLGGEGFTSSTPVTFSGVPATSTKVLSPGFLIATVPAGASPADAVVGTPVTSPEITSPDPGAVNVSPSEVQVSGTGGNGTSVAVEVDGTQFSGCNATVTGGTWSCTIGSLSEGEHTLTATATEASGGTATSSPTLIDVGGSPPASDRINDTDPSIVYSADWSYSANRGLGDYEDDVHYTTTNGGMASWTFLGTGVKVYGELYTDQGNVGISIDGGPEQVVSTLPPGSQRESNQVIWQDSGLAPGQHTVTVTKLSGTYTTLDGFEADYSVSGG
jgi:hypothetical protein